jgi:hypothetical protein
VGHAQRGMSAPVKKVRATPAARISSTNSAVGGSDNAWIRT